MVGGRGVKLAPQSGVTEATLFVCVDVEAGGVESLVRSAGAIERDWLPPEKLRTGIEVLFDDALGKLVARKRVTYGDLVIDDTSAHIADESLAAGVLAEAARRNWERARPADDSAAGRFLLRVRCFRDWSPDSDLPAFDDAELQSLLTDLCRGLRSLEAVRNGPWLDRLRAALTYPQWQRLERDVPESLTVPTGSEIPLVYEVGRPPVLAVRIQELFGLRETPRIAGGRVKVLLHLLAPNHRPQQVTDDLASFWATGYAVVRKELRMKYPKHSWPEDPTTAEPVRGPKKRTT
jgi:ATP-dependent helicase HrpB